MNAWAASIVLYGKNKKEITMSGRRVNFKRNEKSNIKDDSTDVDGGRGEKAQSIAEKKQWRRKKSIIWNTLIVGFVCTIFFYSS